MNRAQRRAAAKKKPQGVSYADQLAKDRLLKASVEKAARDETVRIDADRIVQKMSWLMVCSVADAFGIGHQRMQQFFDAFQANVDEYDRMVRETDQEYADEKLRQRAEQVSGIPIKYLYEEEMRAATRDLEARGIKLEV